MISHCERQPVTARRRSPHINASRAQLGQYLVYTTSKVKPCSLSSLPAACASFTPSLASETSSQPRSGTMNKVVQHSAHLKVVQIIYFTLSRQVRSTNNLPVNRPSLLYSVLPCRMITTMGPVPSTCIVGFLRLTRVWVSSGNSSIGGTGGPHNSRERKRNRWIRRDRGGRGLVGQGHTGDCDDDERWSLRHCYSRAQHSRVQSLEGSTDRLRWGRRELRPTGCCPPAAVFCGPDPTWLGPATRGLHGGRRTHVGSNV